MKVRVIRDNCHDTTLNKVYEVVPNPMGMQEVPGTVWVVDDIGEVYPLINEIDVELDINYTEYEVVNE